jgi:lipopolysaccharide/colanic/teichoic acid biosynthesis glycosyltransferase
MSPGHGTGEAGHNPALAVKRAIDIGLGLMFGIVALPLMVLVAVAIRLDSPGPVLFRPTRVGRHGKHFSMLKFRTMVTDAENRLHEVVHLNVATGMVKIPNDPRVTRVGKWLRRFSLDELPQLYNVLTGDMSIVGPRPHDVTEVAVESVKRQARLSVKPGLTGLWQVSARSDPSLAMRIHYDLLYVHNWSLLMDVRILARTIPTIALGKGDLVQIPVNGAVRMGKKSNSGLLSVLTTELGLTEVVEGTND